MIYTVIYTDYRNELRASVLDGSMNRPVAWKQAKQEYGTVLALVPGSHPVYTSGSMERGEETAYRT